MSLFITANQPLKISQVSEDDEHLPLVLHPLLQLFISLKWKTMQKYVFTDLILHLLLVIFITQNGVHYVQYSSCTPIDIDDCQQDYFKTNDFQLRWITEGNNSMPSDVSLNTCKKNTNGRFCWENDYYQLNPKFDIINETWPK